jgi:hypothetical protein
MCDALSQLLFLEETMPSYWRLTGARVLCWILNRGSNAEQIIFVRRLPSQKRRVQGSNALLEGGQTGGRFVVRYMHNRSPAPTP